MPYIHTKTGFVYCDEHHDSKEKKYKYIRYYCEDHDCKRVEMTLRTCLKCDGGKTKPWLQLGIDWDGAGDN